MHPRLALLLATLLVALPVGAAPSDPEIQRDAAAAQAVGAVHTLRTIPEACTRLEGVFTGRAEPPYAVRAVATAPGCQARSRFEGEAVPGPEGGWILNDRIVVPSAACPGQRAVVEIWRRPGTAAPPGLDAQGRARIHFNEGQQEQRPDTAGLQRFASTLSIEGSCSG